jgi:hypothetical protein
MDKKTRIERQRLINELRDKIKNKTKEIESLTDVLKDKINDISVSSEINKIKEEKNNGK